jgi:hypothetical protein
VESTRVMIALALSLMLDSGQPSIFYYDHRSMYPYDERQDSHPYNPGPKIIVAPIPDKVYEHKHLHLPDPKCLAGCADPK